MLSDLRYALRVLVKMPEFAAIAILTLALGIGSSTAIFSVLYAVLLRPLPYPQQEQIVELNELDEAGRAMSFAEPNFDDLRTRSTSFDALAWYSVWSDAVAGGNEPVRTNICAVSGDFFRVFGVTPFVGRLLASEDATKGNQIVVVSNRFWKRSLGGRTNLEGTTLRFQDRSLAVVGVLPPNVDFPPNIDVWFPWRAIFPPNPSRTGHGRGVVARVRGGVSFERVRAEIAAIGQQLKREHGAQIDAASFGMKPLRERMVKDVRGALLVLCGAVGLLLAIACSNVANLLVVRAISRRKEVALRAALGASRWRLARQSLIETLLLTLCAGGVGILFAFWGVDLVADLYRRDLPRVGQISVNCAAIMFSLGVSVIVGVLLGLVPVLGASDQHLQRQLQDSGPGMSSSRYTSRIRNFLVVSQVALTLMLLVGAGLLGRSFQRLLQVNPGFQPESAVAMIISRPDAEKPAQQRRLAQFYQQLIERLSTLPGVVALGGIDALPMSGTGGSGGFIIEDGGRSVTTFEELEQQSAALRGTDRLGQAEFRVASADYFAAMKIPLIRGRLFQELDNASAPHVALISQSLARRTWPYENPIGKQLQFGGMDGDLHLLHIVGVVGDVHDKGLHVESPSMVYVNYIQRPRYARQFAIVLRARSVPASLISAMRREARALDPEMPTNFQTIEQIVSDSLDNRRFSMMMLGIFAGAALGLAMVGLYGVMSYISSQRITEIGIRMALGAQRADVLRLILRQSLALLGAGIAAGVIAAIGSTRLLVSMLYGVSATDLPTYSAVIVLLLLAALVASYFPARRAMNVDPVEALRYE